MIQVIPLVLSVLVSHHVTLGEFECGRFFPPAPVVRSNFMIIGGKQAPVGLFPWIVSLQFRKNGVWTHTCGGSIIGPEWVITAAHCVEDKTKPIERINAGTIVVNRTTSVHTLVTVFVHSSVKGRNVSDIALIQVTPPFKFTNGQNGNGAILPICLPRVSEQFYGKVTIAGWGTQHDTGNANTLKFPQLLQYVNAQIMNNDLCEIHSNYFNPKSYICTTAINSNRIEGSCYGDSGGPVMGVSNGRAILVALVSGANNYPNLCARETNPPVHSKVSSFRLWIFMRTYI